MSDSSAEHRERSRLLLNLLVAGSLTGTLDFPRLVGLGVESVYGSADAPQGKNHLCETGLAKGNERSLPIAHLHH